MKTLTGVTDEMLRQARDKSLLGRLARGKDTPVEAIAEMTKAIWEHEAADWEIGEEEGQQNWDRLPAGAKQLQLETSAWFIARLALNGLWIVKGES